MDFAPTFQLGHPLAFRAAAMVAELTPPGLDRDLLHELRQRER